MPRLRYQPPDRLIGATAFSEDDELRGSLRAVKLLKEQTWVWDDLRKACAALESGYARKREAGHWELAAVAFIASRQIDIQPWWDETTDELWRECGFAGKPPYMRVWRRLRELETVCEAFLEAAGTVIRRCREHDSRVMAHVHFDWSEQETHAGLLHDCQPGEGCTYQKRNGRRPPGAALRPRRTATGQAREVRQELNSEPPDESAKHDKELLPEDEQQPQGTKNYKRVRVNGCWYRTRDTEAGIRTYKTGRSSRRFWHGFYAGKGVDHLTGGVVPSVDNASTQECHLFPKLYDQVKALAGEAPETAIGDRGLTISSCFQHATTNGTAPIFPWRQHGKNKRKDKLAYDRHGVMRCKHCGGPMSQVKFSQNNGKPRLWFRCMIGRTTDCAKDQTISCSTDWRSLIPLARTEPLYHELKESHKTYEAVHDYWRDRYRVAGDSLANRPKVVSLEWHRLRANVACLIDWLRIAKKNAWLVDPQTGRSASATCGSRRFKKRGENAASSLAKRRVRMGIAQPYGPQAAKLGIGKASLPSERYRGDPPNQVSLDLPGP